MKTGKREREGAGASSVTARHPADAGADYRTLVSGCAVSEPRAASFLEIGGADRLRFVHGQTTCEVKSLAAGEGAYGFFLNAKGRVLADAVISATPDRLQIELPPGAAPDLSAHLGRYVVADRVEIRVADTAPAILVAGPRARATLLRVLRGGEPPAGWDQRELLLGSERVRVRAEKRLGIPAWRLEVADDPSVLVAALEAEGARSVATAQLEIVRIERGVPRAGTDFGDEHFPQETGLEQWAVSYTKGCYLGQEVVARIHYRGKVNHVLRGLRGAGEAAPETGGSLVDEQGAAAGRLTSAAYSPALGRPIGLSILHRRAAAPGTRLATETGDEMEVVELPFVEPGMVTDSG